MATLDIRGRDRDVLPGHGIAALGPSDTSDSGSDVVGGPGLGREAAPGLPLDTGTHHDEHIGETSADATAGADLGDGDLSSDSDSAGTGEHVTAGRDPVEPLNGDRGFDRVVSADDPSLGLADGAQLPDGYTLEGGEVVDATDEPIDLDGNDILDEIEADLEEDAAVEVLEEDPEESPL
jgi:hypothetical protein